MGNQNQDQNRQAQGGAGQRTTPQDPKITPGRDDENRIERQTSDEGQARDQSASGRRSSAGEAETDDLGNTKGSTERGKSGSADQGKTGATRGGNP